MNKIKRFLKLTGAVFFMGIGAFGAGSAYVYIVEHHTGKPINK